MYKHSLLSKIISFSLAVICMITITPFLNNNHVHAVNTFTHDTTAKLLKINHENIEMTLDYNNKCKISSLIVNNLETLDTEGIVSAVQVPRGSSTISTAQLSQSPTVTVANNTATVSGISFSNDYITINETWVFSIVNDDITLNVSKTYDWKNDTYNSVDMQSLGLTFKRDVFDTCFREDGGVNALLSPSDRTKVQDMDDDGTGPDGYTRMTGIGFYGGSVDLVNIPKQFILSIGITSDKKIASEYRLANSTTHSMRLEHKISATDFTHHLNNPNKSLCFHVFNINAASENLKHTYDPVVVGDMQTDYSNYTFSVTNNLDKYYNIGDLPVTSGIDEIKLARFMSELGRTSIVDLKGPAGSWNTLLPEFAGLMESQLAPDPIIAMQYAKGNEVVLEALKALVEVGIEVQEPNGHIRGCAGGQAFEYPDVMEPCAGIPLCAAAYIHAQNATDWANSEDVKNGVRKALDFLLSTDSDNNGLVESKYKTNPGIPQQAWLDSLFQGGEDGYINALTYGALMQWSEIEENIIQDTAMANYYRSKAQKLKETYNKNIIDGGLWSDSYQGFIGWKNMNGTIKCDTKYIHVDAAAIKYDLANKTRANQILFGAFDGYEDIEDWMTKNGAKAYPLNLYPNDNTEELAQFVDEFPDWENGDVFPHITGEMMAAYAKVGSTQANSYFKNLVDLFFTTGDPLWNKDVFTWDLGTNTHGCDYRMGVNMHSAAIFMTDIMGINPKYNCLEVNPTIDRSLFGTEIDYYMRGHKYRIRYDSELVRSVVENDGLEPVRFIWKNMEAGQAYNINDEDLVDNVTINTVVTANSEGNITYDIADKGEHRVTVLTEGVEPEIDNPVESHKATAEFSKIQGQNNWYYEEFLPGDVHNQLSWSSENGYYQGGESFAIIDGAWMHPGNDRDVSRTWVAPKTGIVDISGVVRLKTAGGDGVKVMIKQNNNVYWGWQLIDNTIGIGFKGKMSVNQGDFIQFIVNKNGSSTNDTTIWTPKITYIEEYKFSDNYSNTQGENNWFYKEKQINSEVLMDWIPANSWWKGSSEYSLIMNGKMHPGTQQVKLVFKAPKSGFIRITTDGNVRKEATGGDGIKVCITKENTGIWPYNGQWQFIEGADVTGYGHDVVVYIRKGEEIGFLVDKNTNNLVDTTIWNPIVTYIE